jgi:stearoyl-CoA desaturase (delta-9 desaturase)
VSSTRLARAAHHIPFAALQLSFLAVFFVGWSPVAVAVAVLLFVTRGFGITAFFHRGLSHRAFRTSRVVQFAGAALATAAVQRGPLWWVANHRTHHLYADRPGDVHSPRVHGMAHSHMLWIIDPANAKTDLDRVRDLAAYPELRALERWAFLPPALVAAGCFALGAVLARIAPGTGTSGLQMFVWGFCVSTVAIYHTTWSVNSLGHRVGRRRFETRDDSRNVWWLALVTLGESWHNNHHRYPASARQGFTRSQLDVTWMGLWLMNALGVVWDLRPVPAALTTGAEARQPTPAGNERASLSQ